MDHNGSETLSTWHNTRFRNVIAGLALLALLGSIAWFGAQSISRWVAFRVDSRDSIARGEACAGLNSSAIPEFVDAVRLQMADSESVRPVFTGPIIDDPANPGLTKEELSSRNAPPDDILASMKFAARNQMGGMQFYTAFAALNPKTCEVSLFSIDDENNKSIYDAPLPPARAPITNNASPISDASAFPAIGTCYSTAVLKLTSRLEETPGSGSAVNFTNGLYMVDYQISPEVQRWHVGDQIKMCVTSLPENCPPGDKRGIGYKAKNLRTNGFWEAGDSEHLCGGA